jgi:hypothetical protein
MRRFVLALCCAAVLGGCYSIPRWSPGPEARERDFERDDYQCILETAQRRGGANSESKRDYIICMELRGWTETDEGIKGGWRPS